MEVDVWTKYGELVGKEWATLTDAQRALVAVGELRAEINNGGFDQYFFNSGGDLAPVARAAASTAGITTLVDLVDRAMAVFGSMYITDRFERQEALLSLTVEATFEELDREYYDLEATMDLDALMEILARSA